VKAAVPRERARPRLRLGSRYWDRVAGEWKERVFNTLKEDRRGAIAAELKRAARGAATTADFGCGVGVYFPLLSRLFAAVHGFDFSARCIRAARRKARRLPNVTAQVAASAPRALRGRFDVVLCVNAALHPSRREWLSVLRSSRALMKPRGQLLLVVPALESAALIARAKNLKLRGRRGVVQAGRVPTKHYARNELVRLLAGLGLEVARIRRVEYSWWSHGITPPPRLRKTGPWDWLAVAHASRALSP
jgi:2-polyprenyl-3-methyl-5-hydroxy-6-metoxy-1,4-benzoquinol methylase